MSVIKLNAMFSELSEISDRTYFPFVYVSGVFPDITVNVADFVAGDFIKSEMNLLPALHGMLSYYLTSIISDEQKTLDFYDVINRYLTAWNLKPMPIIVAYENKDLNVHFYSLMALPENLRHESSEQWLSYCTRHIEKRMTNSANPYGIYMDELDVTLAYAQLLATIIVRNDMVIGEPSSTFEVPQTRELHD